MALTSLLHCMNTAMRFPWNFILFLVRTLKQNFFVFKPEETAL